MGSATRGGLEMVRTDAKRSRSPEAGNLASRPSPASATGWPLAQRDSCPTRVAEPRRWPLGTLGRDDNPAGDGVVVMDRRKTEAG